jgi:dolichol-phosphate mannosyltransferase
MNKTLIFIPTYNERENAPRMCAEISSLGLDADLLFVDDNSPDGTGEEMERLKSRFPKLIVHHRTGKLGVGSAHHDAIMWAYDQGYESLVTLDCDFTHSPSDIPNLIACLADHDVAVGSRWLNANSLPGWNVFRRFMTWGGHWLTKTLLGLSQDASGAFRAYRLDRIDQRIFTLIQSKGYSFFFESLFVLVKNGCSVVEMPIVLPARTYGHSKMTADAAIRSARYVIELCLSHLVAPERHHLDERVLFLDENLDDPQNWDGYWQKSAGNSGILYDLIAAWYRQQFIRKNLDKAILAEFPTGSTLLHAGCGSGQVDRNLQHSMKITALDISKGALRLYSRNNPKAIDVVHGDIMALPFQAETFDGYYNLGVVEHFTPGQILKILSEAKRVLRPGGRMVIFWPHRLAPSVMVLGIWHWILKHLLRSEAILHPLEISLLRSRSMGGKLIQESGMVMKQFKFDSSDLFIQAIITVEKPHQSSFSSAASNHNK